MTDTQIRTTVYKAHRPRRHSLNAGWACVLAALLLLGVVFAVGQITGWKW